MPDREIYLEEDTEGLQARPAGSVPLRGLSRVCFFVHGYNVTLKKAQQAFDRLIEVTRREAHVPEGVVASSLDGSQAWRIYWPAYGRLGRDRWALSALTYPWHVADAESWAAALARCLSRELESPNGSPVEITFVAHSLGCRLVLEVLRSKLSNRHNNWQVRLLFLMAAAVPVHLVEHGERLRRAALDPAVSHVAYSPRDVVLQSAFRVGQMIEGGWLPTAVGSWGQPAALWSQRIATENGHSDYFSDARTARHLAAALGLRVRREIEWHDITRRPATTRTLATSPSPARRSLGSRRIGG